MAPTSNSTAAPTQGAVTPDVQRIEATDEESGLPGMKRGIAIGVACSVTILLVALLTYIAVRRRKRLAAKKAAADAAKSQPVAEVEGDGGFWPAAASEKPRYTEAQHMGVHRGSPIEADAHTIHELDAQQIPELPGTYASHELEAGGKKTQGEGLDEYAQTQRQWEMWKYAPEEHHEQQYHDRADTKHTPPVLTVSSPGSNTPHGVVSPLGQPPYTDASHRSAFYDAPSPNPSPSPYTPPSTYASLSTYPSPSPYDTPSPAPSPFEEVHLLAKRSNGNYDVR